MEAKVCIGLREVAEGDIPLHLWALPARSLSPPNECPPEAEACAARGRARRGIEMVIRLEQRRQPHTRNPPIHDGKAVFLVLLHGDPSGVVVRSPYRGDGDGHGINQGEQEADADKIVGRISRRYTSATEFMKDLTQEPPDQPR